MLRTEGLTLHYGGSQILYGIDMEAERVGAGKSGHWRSTSPALVRPAGA